MGLDEAAKKVKSLPATVTAAMQIKTLHHHKKHRHGDNSALLQQEEEAKKKSIEAALDKAKITLGNNLGEDSYEDKTFQPTRRITRKGLVKTHRELPIKTKNGLVQVVKRVGSTPSPDEVNRSSPLSAEGAEALVNMTMETSPEPVSYNPDDLMEKCTVSGSPSCPMLRDALS